MDEEEDQAWDRNLQWVDHKDHVGPPPNPMIHVRELWTRRMRWSQEELHRARNGGNQCTRATTFRGWSAILIPGRRGWGPLWGLQYNVSVSPDVKHRDYIRDRREQQMSIRQIRNLLAKGAEELVEYGTTLWDRLQAVHACGQIKGLLTTLSLNDENRPYVAELHGYTWRRFERAKNEIERWHAVLLHEERPDEDDMAKRNADWLKLQIGLLGVDAEQVRPLPEEPLKRLLAMNHMYFAIIEMALVSHCREHGVWSSERLLGDSIERKIGDRHDARVGLHVPGNLFLFGRKALCMDRMNSVHEIWAFQTNPNHGFHRHVAILANVQLFFEIFSRRTAINGHLFHPSNYIAPYAFAGSVGYVVRWRENKDGPRKHEPQRSEILCTALLQPWIERTAAFPPRGEGYEYDYDLLIV